MRAGGALFIWGGEGGAEREAREPAAGNQCAGAEGKWAGREGHGRDLCACAEGEREGRGERARGGGAGREGGSALIGWERRGRG